MKLKPSKYNHFFPYNDHQHVAYNALINSLALIENDQLAAYHAFCKDGTALPEDLLTALKKGSFIISDFKDELELLRFRMLQSRFNTDHYSLTLVPTNNCNFRCNYCFQKNVIKNATMSIEVQDKIVELLEQQVKTISSFNVTWYGGEPLMAFDVVIRLSEKFIKLCGDNNVKYSASMITNGYLLTRDVLEKLAAIKCTTIQVTIDGTPNIHNTRRPLAGGGETFDTIMQNLKNGYDLLPYVGLRINIDKDNIDAGRDIFKFLTENGMTDKIKPYFGKLSNFGSEYDDSNCLNMCDFSEHHYDYLQSMTGVDSTEVLQYPTLKTSSCAADRLHTAVIDAEGRLYKCWCDVGVEARQINSLVEPFTPTSNLFYDYMMLDPTTNPQCMVCNVLPICMGGCPFKRLAGDSDNCTSHKFILETVAKNAITALKKQKENADA